LVLNKPHLTVYVKKIWLITHGVFWKEANS
jgi:hypothetical protein